MSETKWILAGVQKETLIGGKTVIIPHGGGAPVAYVEAKYAHLIAAAPSLYEALVLAKEAIDDQITRFHKDCRCVLCESLPMRIDAALALARGEARETGR